MKDDKALREELMRQIAIINRLPRTVRREIEYTLKEDYNVGYDKTIDIFNGILRVETLPYHMLYKLMKSIKKVSISDDRINSGALNEDSYFYELEKDEYGKKVISDKGEEDFDIIIKSGNWFRVDIYPYDYIFIHTDINEVEKWDFYNKLRYNPDTQRDLIIVENDGVPIVKLNLNKTALKEIKSGMQDLTQFPTIGTININPEVNGGNSVLIKDGDLIIPKELKLDLIDGFHNHESKLAVKRNNQDWNYPCDYYLTFFDTEKARDYIYQMDRKTHLSKSQSIRISGSDPISYIINKLNTSTRSRLKGTIDSKLNVYIYDVIKKIMDINKDNQFEIYEIISDNLNYLVSHDKKKTLLSKEDWFTYIYIINKLIIKEYDLEKLITLNSFKDYMINLKIANKPTKTQMNELDKIIEGVR